VPKREIKLNNVLTVDNSSLTLQMLKRGFMTNSMCRFSLSTFLSSLVMAFVALHLFVALPEEPIYSFAHNDAHSERCHSQEQEAMSTQTTRKTSERQTLESNRSRIFFNSVPVLSTLTASPIPSNSIICLSSVILRV
jgi:hypothetical protein